MGEYIKYNDEEIKIGTMYNLYYATYDKYMEAFKAGKLTQGEGDEPKAYTLADAGFSYRFPFPDEDNLPLGDIGKNQYDRGWKDLNDYLHNNKGKIQSLVVSDLDRIGRDVIKTSDEIAHIERKYTIEVCSVKGRVNLKDLGQLLKPAQIAPMRRRSDKRLRK